jgi:hypothetical protein
MVFGEALVDAYRIETELARYPRVMVMSDIVRDIEGYCAQAPSWKAALDNRLLQSSDGPWYVHVLRTVESDVAEAHHQNINGVIGSGPVLEAYDELRKQMQRRFDQSVDNPRHFEKVQWFARYWNKSTPFGTKNNLTVVGPGLDVAEWTIAGQSDGLGRVDKIY